MTVRGVELPGKPDVEIMRDNIVRVDLCGFRHLGMDQVRFIHNERMRKGGCKPQAILLIASDILTIDFEVQIFASRPDLILRTSSLAIVGDSFMLRHFVALFMSYHAPAYPVELFADEDSAMAWLNQLQDNAEEERSV